ncbi:efflux RND transporter periplasmic adaptor subunit [Fundidesulfovibrio agrisoli]|uniref:efflux RND transporter periplasmic adaptor subunit n=1 Tax=Fundidesulfovibrio agrisoli TaxID=2922717 RepID=UPI001FAD60B9|nr:efflux RND transporter periplasmic adaptor subunit [Fundidesulfovibrio agrisoli]
MKSRSGLRALWLVIVFSLVLAGCSDDDKKRSQARPPAPVSVAVAASGTVPVRIAAVGNVEPVRSVAVRTQVGGQIVEQRVRDGQEVAAGEVLFVLDGRPFKAALLQAQGKLERDQALLKRAEDDLARYTGLKQKDVVSQQQFDQAQSDAKSLRGSIKLSEAEIEQAKLQLEYSVIKAPFAGRVGTVQVNVGNVIKANDDRSLLTLVQIQPIYVSFSVPEQHLPEVASRLGKTPLEVTAFLAGDDANPERGVLASVDNSVDRTTGTIRLKGLFQNDSKRLWPGQFAKVALNLANREGVVSVPSPAVQQGLQGSYVYVVTPQNKAEFRLVETGGSIEGRTIVSKGLSGGETVVTDGHVRLAPGSTVEVKNPSANAKAPDAKAEAGAQSGAQGGAPGAEGKAQ